jgi:hypothetical protein
MKNIDQSYKLKNTPKKYDKDRRVSGPEVGSGAKEE